MCNMHKGIHISRFYGGGVATDGATRLTVEGQDN
jgi:hypothetical protein